MVVFNELSIVRDISLSFLVLFIGFNIEFIVLFLYKWFRSPYKNFSDSRFLWTLLLTAFSLQQLFFLISDFMVSGNEAMLFTNLGYLSVAVGIVTFIYIQENVLPFNTHKALTILSAVTLAVLMVLPRDLQMFLAVTLVALFGGIFILFSRYLLKVSTGRDKQLFLMFITGIVLIALGELLTAQLVYQVSILFYPAGALLLLLGGIITNYSLYALPSFLELDWLRQIKEIYVSFLSGIPVFYAKVKDGKIQKQKESDETMITTGILSALKSALKRVTESKQVTSYVDQGDVKIIFGTSEQLLVAVVTTRNIPIIHEKIVTFLNQANKLFRKQLENWSGDPSTLEPIHELLLRVFLE